MDVQWKSFNSACVAALQCGKMVVIRCVIEGLAEGWLARVATCVPRGSAYQVVSDEMVEVEGLP